MSGGLRGLAAITIALALVGCSDDGPGPTVLPSRTTTASAAPSASPAPTALTPQGAADFARYFLLEVETAYATGSTAVIERISAPHCAVCKRYITSIRDAYDSGGRYEGGDVTIRFAEAPAFEGDVAVVTVVVAITEQREIAPDGAVKKTLPADEKLEGNVKLTKAPAGWLVSDFTLAG